jgi:hypothetical protein
MQAGFEWILCTKPLVGSNIMGLPNVNGIDSISLSNPAYVDIFMLDVNADRQFS